MQNRPDENWLKKYDEIKSALKPKDRLDDYFTQSEIAGKKMYRLEMGTVNFPTGKIIACDPFFLYDCDQPYFTSVPIGTFPLTAAVAEVGEDHYRYAAIKVAFNDNKVAYFVEALCGNEDLESFEEGFCFGFNVDAGLGTIIDVKTRGAFLDYIEKLERESGDPDWDIYFGFAKPEFEKNYKANPKYQIEGGDWFNFAIPNTDLNIPVFASGWGDGRYSVYFGYDSDNNICQVVIQFIGMELNFGGDNN
ncbi:MAG: DUF4241 domain-containing protein [Helicobacteraceae bacterium]|jgi:hypothetical protein|nr:DUF4241 domain-containing protein [Helicobacteraceae bacterium]